MLVVGEMFFPFVAVVAVVAVVTLVTLVTVASLVTAIFCLCGGPIMIRSNYMG